MTRPQDVAEPRRGQPSSDPRSERLGLHHPVAAVLVVAALYFIIGRIGLVFAISPGFAAPIWPAAGVAVAAMILVGSRAGPGVVLGSFLVNLTAVGVPLTNPQPYALAGAIAVGAGLQAWVGAALVGWVLRRDPGLLRARSTVSFLLAAGPIACLVSASLGTLSLVAAGVVSASAATYSFSTWWVGDTIGVTLVTPVALIFLARPRALWRRRRWPVVVPLIVALGVVAGAFWMSAEAEHERIRLEFVRDAQALGGTLERQLDRYQDAVQSLRDFASQGEGVGRDGFRHFASRTVNRLPGLLALGWNPLITGDELGGIEAAARAEGYEGFTVRERATDGRLVAVSPRPRHVVVRYVEPHEANREAHGFDVYSDPVRRSAIDAALADGVATATARISLVQDASDQAGVLLFVPVYETRRTADGGGRPLGFAVGVLRLRDVAEIAFGQTGPLGVVTRLFDGSNPSDPKPLATVSIGAPGVEAPSPSAGDAPMPAARLVLEVPIRFGNRQWRLSVSATDHYVDARRSWAQWWVLAAGFAFTAVLGGFLLILTGRAIRDEARANELEEVNAALAREIREHERTERALALQKERAEVTLQSIGDAVITTDGAGLVEFVNPAAESLTGWTNDEASGRPLAEVYRTIDDETREPVAVPGQRGQSEDGSAAAQAQVLLLARDGRELAIEDAVDPIRDRDGAMLGAVVVFHDVTETRRIARAAVHDATHDALTGLVNRREFDRRLQQAVSSSGRYGGVHALCFLDLDRFKIVNDTVGHSAGDQLLKDIAGVLAREVRDRDTVARLGGDEFALLLSNCPPGKARDIAEAVLNAVGAFVFEWEQRTFQIGVSIGVVPIDGGPDTAEALLGQADEACYAAKNAGRNRVFVHRNRSDARLSEQVDGLAPAALREGLEQGRMQLQIRPVVPLAPATRSGEMMVVAGQLVDEAGAVHAGEALARAADRFGLAVPLDRWLVSTVLEERCQQLAGEASSLLFVLLAGTPGSEDGMVDLIRDRIRAHGVAPARLCFVLGETRAIRNVVAATRLFEALKGLGCRVALGSLGHGLSSLSHLDAMRPDYLGIDAALVHGIVEDPGDRAMLEAIQAVARRLGLRTIAESANEGAGTAALVEIGIDYAWGPVVARAIDGAPGGN